MDCPDPDIASTDHPSKSPRGLRPRQFGCLATAVGCLIGLFLGGLHGFREYNAAVEAAMRESGFADYLPVGVPIWAVVGAVLGALVGVLASVLMWGGWRQIARTAGSHVNKVL